MLKRLLTQDGLAFAVLILFGLVHSCEAAHGHHHHKDILDRVLHKGTAGSHSSLNATGALVEPTSSDRSPFQSIEPPLVSSELQLDDTNLKQGQASLTTTLGRFWHVTSAQKGTASETPAGSTNTPKTKLLPTPIAKLTKYYPVVEKAFQGYLAPKIARRQDASFQSFSLAPLSTASPSASVCPTGNTTEYTSGAGIKYQVVCNIDFNAHNHPFQLVGSFEACVQKCDAYNYDNHGLLCLAALYVPSREGDADDCYLKSSVANPESSNLGIEGAVRLGPNGTPLFPPTPSSTSIVTSVALTTNVTSTGLSVPSITGSSFNSSISAGVYSSGSAPVYSSTFLSSGSFYSNSNSPSTSSTLVSISSSRIPASYSSPISSSTSVSSSSISPSASASALPSSGSNAGITYASGNQVIVPEVAGSHLHGPTVNTPSKQWINYVSQPGITLSQSLLTVGVNPDLTTGYPISDQTGALEVNISTQSLLLPLSETPHLSRDGGRGGFLGGQHLFVFDDTGSYTTTTESSNGNFLGFVSSSVAIDVGMNGLFGQPLNLQDGIGEWSDASGRQRGFAPLTEGEQSYNQVLQGNGQRYAVWPESSIIPLGSDTGVIFAPLVYDNVNRATNVAVFTYAGATLLTITAGGRGGPVAERTVPRIFDSDEIEWGCSGGIRSWGPSGVGGYDGYVYFFGVISGGILAGRTTPDEIGNRDAFQYWDGTQFTNTMPTSSSTAFFATGPFMDIDIFYSPRHLTFIIVYMTIYADNTFYYRYLEADQGILPPFAPNGDASSDYVENIFKYNWSDEQFLYKAGPSLSGRYVYAGGVHAGYYGANDITNGGSRMLLSWTAPTGLDPSSYNSEYQIITAEAEWV